MHTVCRTLEPYGAEPEGLHRSASGTLHIEVPLIDLVNAGSADCLFCRIVGSLYRKYWMREYMPDFIEDDHVRVTRTSKSLGHEISIRAAGDPGPEYGLVVRSCAGFEPPLAVFTPMLVPPQDPLASEVQAQINVWNLSCLRDHASCSRVECDILPLPSRVLDLAALDDSGDSGGSGDLQLLETKGQTGRYVALSYRWGQGLTYLTTKDSLQDRIARIRSSELPRTLRDAVVYTRSLNIRYLWVDSLCIIQHDMDDWEREAGQMYAVYGNAYLVLAAVRATSTEEGFLDVRRRGYIQAQVSGRDSEGKEFSVVGVSASMDVRINESTHQDFGTATEHWAKDRLPLWTDGLEEQVWTLV